MHKLKAQSAMEYLMTYGWAILIIAFVLGALFGLGFFNSANLAPKVGPGSCQIYRPQGPGTTQFINTEGVCNNELPQYAAQFNGASSYINTGTTAISLNTPSTITVSAWINPSTSALSSGGSYRFIDNRITGQGAGFFIETGLKVYHVDFNFYTPTLYTLYSSSSINPNTWYDVVVTYNGNTGIANMYLNGQISNTLTASGNIVSSGSSPLLIGAQVNVAQPFSTSYYFQGSIANVQIYNTSFTANEVTTLYDEGIGGNPLLLNNLIGWWPLNGNANDYSGNINNGVPTNVIFTNSWASTYSAP
jgi:hypothetical protein